MIFILECPKKNVIRSAPGIKIVYNDGGIDAKDALCNVPLRATKTNQLTYNLKIALHSEY